MIEGKIRGKHLNREGRCRVELQRKGLLQGTKRLGRM
jgi:hypothetical protein